MADGEKLIQPWLWSHGLGLVGSTFVLCNLGKVFKFEWGSVFFGRDGFSGLLFCGSCLAVACGFV